MKHFYRKIHKLGGCVYLNPDGECTIIRSIGEKPVKSRLRGDPAFYPNSYTEESVISNSCSGGLLRLFVMPVAYTLDMCRTCPVLKPAKKIQVYMSA
jgi:hypothetical protein